MVTTSIVAIAATAAADASTFSTIPISVLLGFAAPFRARFLDTGGFVETVLVGRRGRRDRDNAFSEWPNAQP